MSRMNHGLAQSMVALMLIGSLISLVGCSENAQMELDPQVMPVEACNDSIVRWAESTETLPRDLERIPQEVHRDSFTGSRIVPTCTFEGLDAAKSTLAEIYVCSTSPQCAEIFATADAAVMSRNDAILATEVIDSHKTYIFTSSDAQSAVSIIQKPVDFVDYMGYPGGYAVVVIWKQSLK